SPVLYADRIQTPLMIMFGAKDDAVPWEQGVEMYLAMRRAGKEVVFLQYEDEPHHLKKYPNKLDYSIRMMQYFDHYLKGKPAPEWLSKGEAYVEYKADDE
ncbi:MAG: alpha/beta hydrolase family protein, partial [Shewanella oncorhynchi]